MKNNIVKAFELIGENKEVSTVGAGIDFLGYEEVLAAAGVDGGSGELGFLKDGVVSLEDIIGGGNRWKF